MYSGDKPYCYEKEEWLEIKSQFESDFSRYNKHIKSFNTLINEILKDTTQSEFVSRTELSPNMLHRITKTASRKDPPRRSTLMSIAVGYNLDIQLTEALLESLGLSFDMHNRRDYAYQLLLTRCRGVEIEDCNKILELLGIEEKDWLGAYAKNTR